MTCISPTDGWPASQLLSHLFTIVGLPPDSWFILRSTVFSHDAGWPIRDSACRITPAHLATPEPPPGPPGPPAAAACAACAAFANAAASLVTLAISDDSIAAGAGACGAT